MNVVLLYDQITVQMGFIEKEGIFLQYNATVVFASNTPSELPHEQARLYNKAVGLQHMAEWPSGWLVLC